MTDVEDSRTEYGVNTTNKFAFLDDDSYDPTELLNRPKEKKVKQPKVPKAAVVSPPAPVAPVKHEGKENNENRRPAGQNRGPNDRRSGPPRAQQRGGDKMAERFGEKPRDENRPPRRDGPPRDPNNRPPRREFVNREGGNRFPRGPRNDNRQAQNNDDAFNQTDEQVVQTEGGDRQPKQGRGYARDNPRQFRHDRTSGSDKTGVRSQAKKQGHGAANWGNTEDQLAGETEPLNQASDESQTKVDDGAAVEAVDENAPAVEEEQPAEPKEEEPPKMTLEEWKAQHATAKVEFKTRQANEGADQKSLQKFVPLKREEDEKKTAIDEENKKKKGIRSNVVNIELSFNDPNRRDYGGPRRGGDRDNFRSGPHRGGPNRGGSRQTYGTKLDMSADFPALGAH